MYLNNIINNSMDLNELKKLLDFEDIKTKHEKFVFFIDYFVNWFSTIMILKNEPIKLADQDIVKFHFVKCLFWHQAKA